MAVGFGGEIEAELSRLIDVIPPGMTESSRGERRDEGVEEMEMEVEVEVEMEMEMEIERRKTRKGR